MSGRARMALFSFAMYLHELTPRSEEGRYKNISGDGASWGAARTVSPRGRAL